MTLKSFCFRSMAILGLAMMISTQTQAQTTATANVNVTLSPLLSINVNDANVPLALNTLTDYQNGVSVEMPGQLTVSSLLPYSITVKANGATLSDGTATPNTMDVDIVTVGITSTNLGVTPAAAAPLSATTAYTLATGALPALAKPLDVTYSIPETVSNSDKVLGHPSGTYTQVITYTIAN